MFKQMRSLSANNPSISNNLVTQNSLLQNLIPESSQSQSVTSLLKILVLPKMDANHHRIQSRTTRSVRSPNPAAVLLAHGAVQTGEAPPLAWELRQQPKRPATGLSKGDP